MTLTFLAAPVFEDALKKFWAAEERKRVETLERGKKSNSLELQIHAPSRLRSLPWSGMY